MTHNERRELKTAVKATAQSIRPLDKAVKVMALMTHRINLLEWELMARRRRKPGREK